MMRRYMYHHILALLLVLALAQGCSVTTPGEQRAASLATVASWTATAHMAGEAWAAGSVPAAYARQTFAAAARHVAEERDALEQSGGDQALLGATADVQQLLDQMAAAAAEGDPAAVAAQMAQLASQEQRFSALVRSAEGQQ